MFDGLWRKRALAAEAKLADCVKAIDIATEHLDGCELRLADRAALISITREGNTNRFTFVRHGQIYRIATYGTYDDDMQQWKKDLLDAVPMARATVPPIGND